MLLSCLVRDVNQWYFAFILCWLFLFRTTNIRGMLLTGTGIFATLGTLVVYSVGPYVPYSATSYVGLAITFVYIGGLLFIPESPVFYVLKGIWFQNSLRSQINLLCSIQSSFYGLRPKNFLLLINDNSNENIYSVLKACSYFDFQNILKTAMGSLSR